MKISWWKEIIFFISERSFNKSIIIVQKNIYTLNIYSVMSTHKAHKVQSILQILSDIFMDNYIFVFYYWYLSSFDNNDKRQMFTSIIFENAQEEIVLLSLRAFTLLLYMINWLSYININLPFLFVQCD